jgi:uridine kinase
LDQFAGWVKDYMEDPLHQDAYERADRVCRLLQAVDPVEDERPIPKDSVLREFIGGSSYTY